MHSSPTKLSYADYARIPEDGKRHEILGGAHFVNPAPSPYHQTIVTRLCARLVCLLEDQALARVLVSPLDVELTPHDIVQPDLVVLAAENTEILGEQKLHGAPDLIVEVLSPSTSTHDRERKRALYARCGVREYWLADPAERQIEQLLQSGETFRSAGSFATRIRIHGFPGVEVDLTTVW